MSITALIIDDEELARENLAMFLDSYCPSIQVVGKGGSKEEAKKLIAKLKPQVVFLDICMPSGVEGLTLLDELEEKDFLVVFVTAFHEYAIKAFNANAVHYILKPIDIDELIDAVKKVEERLEFVSNSIDQKNIYQESIAETTQSIKTGNQNKLTISHSKGIKIISTADIVHIEADNNCSTLFFNDGTKYTDTRTLKVYENILPENNFYRIHKSYIVNLTYLKEYISADGGYAKLTNGKEVPISRTKTKEFRELIKNLN